VGLIAALATMAVTTAGFLRKCCPSDVFGAIRLAEAADDADCPLFLAEFDRASREASEYGADADVNDAPDGRARLLFFGMIVWARLGDDLTTHYFTFVVAGCVG